MKVNFNIVSGTIPDEEHAAALGSIKAIENVLAPIAITLPTEEKVALAKVGAEMMEFNDKVYDYAVANPELKPGYLNMVEFEKDVKAAKQLKEMINHLVPLLDKLNDTHAVASAEAYSSARIFYHHVKNAANANVPGASAIAKELGKIYHRPGAPRENKAETAENKENKK